MAAERDEQNDDAAATARSTAVQGRSALFATLSNAAVMFVMAVLAVLVGGYLNAILHPAPTPEYVLDPKTNLIKVYVPPQSKDHAQRKAKRKDQKKNSKKPPAPALFYSLDPPLVVNFEESSDVRFLQIGMDIMARDPQVIAAVEKHVPMIRNNLLLLISNRDYAKLMAREGKEELRAQSLAEVRSILKKETGDGAGVEDLLFTSFIVQ